MQQFVQFVANHWVLFAALAVIAVMLAFTLMGGISMAARNLSPAEAVRLINREDAVVVDLRDAAEFGRGHILNAINIPDASLGGQLAQMQKFRERPVLVCCASGTAAGRAGAVLKKAGYTRLYALRGGIAAWQQDNLPLSKE